jgi:NAD(P)-dependent dehydrogenase (short-subunit alcohol dehydrogenase family)
MSTTATRTRGMLEVCAYNGEQGAYMSEQGAGGVALVTGANRGIGREVARQLAALGYEVLASARDGAQAQATAAQLAAETGASVKALTLDVSNPQSVAAAVESVTADTGRLDVLVNNAGIGSDFGVSGVAPDFEAMQRALNTNFFGSYRVTVGLLGLLRASEHPRVVNVSSGMGGITEMGGWSPGYRASKAALNAMTRILSTELKDDGFLVNSACPGFVASDMGGPMGATKSVQDGASGIVWLATLPDDGPTGGFFRDGKAIAF